MMFSRMILVNRDAAECKFAHLFAGLLGGHFRIEGKDHHPGRHHVFGVLVLEIDDVANHVAFFFGDMPLFRAHPDDGQNFLFGDGGDLLATGNEVGEMLDHRDQWAHQGEQQPDRADDERPNAAPVHGTDRLGNNLGQE